MTPNELTNGVINSCFYLLTKDIVRLYAAFNDGMINLLGKKTRRSRTKTKLELSLLHSEKYFDMNKKQCREALDIYKKFLDRTDKVGNFLKVAEVRKEKLEKKSARLDEKRSLSISFDVNEFVWIITKIALIVLRSIVWSKSNETGKRLRNRLNRKCSENKDLLVFVCIDLFCLIESSFSFCMNSEEPFTITRFVVRLTRVETKRAAAYFSLLLFSFYSFCFSVWSTKKPNKSFFFPQKTLWAETKFRRSSKEKLSSFVFRLREWNEAKFRICLE